MGKKKPELHKPWEPGQSGNPRGRPLGSRTKLSEAFLCDLYTHWQEHGADVLKRVSSERPDVFLRVMASVMPKELHFRGVNAFEGMSDDAVNQIVDAVGREISSRTASSSQEGSDTPSVNKLLN